MQSNDLPVIDPAEDLSQILPVQQKRMVAFLNHFIMHTVSQLNNFASSCESRFMEVEYKMQKVDASLRILESQLTSIDDLRATNKENTPVESQVKQPNMEEGGLDDQEYPKIEDPMLVSQPQGPQAKEDPRFQRFFKMLHVGVPEPAVKLKMQSEGLDPSILNHPDDVLTDLNKEQES